MHYTGRHWGTPLKDPIFKLHGKQGDNASKITKTPNHKGKGLGKLHSTPPWPQNHGTTSQFPWILIEQAPQGGTGEDKEGEHHKEIFQEQRT